MKREKIEDVLIKIGVPVNNKGFEYIIDAVQFFDENGIFVSITKELYPGIAKKYQTTPSRVERNIRHAFEVARSCKKSYDIVDHYIGFSNIKNSNSIKQLYMMLRREEE